MINALAKWLKSLLRINTLPDCIGVDLSTSAVKLVELKPNSFTVMQYIMQDIESFSGDTLDNLTKTSDMLRKYWLNVGFQYKTTAMTLPYSSIITKTISAPIFTNKIDLDSYVQKQVANLFEVDINSVDFDYYIIKMDNSGKN